MDTLSFRLEEAAGLSLPELCVRAAFLHELCVRAILHDPAASKHDDAVEGCHGGEAVGHHDRGAAAHEVPENLSSSFVSVVLPDPERPTRPTRWPGAISRFRSSKT